MKKIFVMIVALILSLFTFTGCTPKKQLICYTNSGFPPFEYTQGTKVVGVDMEIAQAIADKLGYELVIKDVQFESIVAGIAEDNAIGAAGITVDAERAEKVDFSTTYFTAKQWVIYTKGSLTTDADGAVDPAQMKGKKLGVQTGTSGSFLAEDGVAEGGIFEGGSVEYYNDALVATLAIGSGCDFVIIDSVVAQQIVAKSSNTNLACAEIAGAEPESYAIAVKKGNADLLKVVNEVVDKMIKDGTIDALVNKHSQGQA